MIEVMSSLMYFPIAFPTIIATVPHIKNPKKAPSITDSAENRVAKVTIEN